MKITRLIVLCVLIPMALLACSDRTNAGTFDVKVTDLNGTWFLVQTGGPDRDQLFRSPGISDAKFSWGMGKRVPNATYEFDLAKRYFFVPPGLAGEIVTTKKINSTDVEVKVVMLDALQVIKDQDLSGVAKQQAIQDATYVFVVRFADRDHITVDHPNEIGTPDNVGPFGIVVGDKPLRFFRLSGPKDPIKTP